jgi:hypothetical protein
MENKEKVLSYIKIKLIENKRHSFSINVIAVAEEINLAPSEIKNILAVLEVENMIAITSNKVFKQPNHTSDLPDILTVLNVVY